MRFAEQVKETFRFAKAEAPLGILGLFILALAIGATEGLGIITVLPLLALSGRISGVELNDSPIFIRVADFFGQFNFSPSLSVVLLIFISLLTLRAALGFLEQRLAASVQGRAVANVRTRLFSTVLAAEWVRLLAARSQNLQHQLTSNAEKVGYLIHNIVGLAVATTIGAVYLGVSLIIAPLATLVAAIGAGAAVWILRGLVKSSAQIGENYITAEGRFYHLTEEQISNLKMIRTFGKERDSLDLLKQTAGLLRRAEIQHSVVQSRYQAALEVLSGITLSVIILIAVGPLKISSGSVILLVFIFSRVAAKFLAMQYASIGIIALLPSYRELRRLECSLGRSPEQSSNDNQRIDVQEWSKITLRGVSFGYDSSSPVLKNVEFELRAGEMLAIVGTSGAGKTTLLDLIIGLLKPNCGEIRIDQLSMTQVDLRKWGASIGYVAQDTQLFDQSIADNLRYGAADASDSELEEILGALGIKYLWEREPQGKFQVGRCGERLSAGERQRIAIAQAILRKPKLLLLDEATSALDDRSENLVVREVCRRYRTMSTILVTHRASLAEHADVLFELQDGKLLERRRGNADPTTTPSQISSLLH